MGVSTGSGCFLPSSSLSDSPAFSCLQLKHFVLYAPSQGLLRQWAVFCLVLFCFSMPASSTPYKCQSWCFRGASSGSVIPFLILSYFISRPLFPIQPQSPDGPEIPACQELCRLRVPVGMRILLGHGGGGPGKLSPSCVLSKNEVTKSVCWLLFPQCCGKTPNKSHLWEERPTSADR